MCIRDSFEVDANNIVMTATYALFKEGTLDEKEMQKIYKKSAVKKNKNPPWKE